MNLYSLYDMESSVQNRRTVIILLLLIFVGITIFAAATIFLIRDQNSPQKQLDRVVQEYKSITFRTAIPKYNMDTLEAVREGLVNRALKAEKYLSSGDKDKAKNELTALKKRIEFQSRGDKADTKATQGKIRNLDENGDGISDYLEPFYKVVLNVIKQLQ